MSVSVTLNNTVYTIPQGSETGWDVQVTTWIQAASSSTLQKSGGTFVLTADVDFGANFGLKALYFNSRSSNPGSTGVYRLANNESVVWRNAGNSGDNVLKSNASDQLVYNGIILSAAAGFTANRLMVTDSSGDASTNSVTATEAARLSGVLSSVVGISDSQALTNKTIDASLNTISNITSLGTVTSGTWSATTIALNKGGTGQTTKAAAFDALQPMTTSGDIIYGGAAGTGTRLAKGSDNQVLTLASGLPIWSPAAVSATSRYFSGSFAAGTWSTTSNSFVDGTNGGGNTLTNLVSNGLTVTAGGSNVCGVTWTPSSSSAIYFVSVTFANSNTSAGQSNYFRITDGTNVVMKTISQPATANANSNVVLLGVYAPGTGAAVTLKVQFACSNGTLNTLNAGSALADNVNWTIIQIV